MLTSRTAQRIADEVMASFGYNITVMDSTGVIIGSGDASRIGSFHEAGKLVVDSGETITLTANDTKNLLGVNPGIIMPICISGVTVGCIGVTGEPEEIKNAVRLVRMAAELLIEQEETAQKFYAQRSDKNAFVLSLLNVSGASGAKSIAAWSMELGYDLELPRIACVLDYPCGCSVRSHDDHELRLEAIKDHALKFRQDISVSIGDSVLVFKTLNATSPRCIEAEIADYMNELRSEVGGDAAAGLRCLVGCYHPGIQGYGQSYMEANRLRVYAPTDVQLSFAHRRIEVEFFEFLSADYRQEVLTPYVNAVRREFGDGAHDAMKTASALLANGYHYEDAAAKLYVHKNTIAFRRKKLEKCLGLNPRENPGDQLLLMLIIMEYLSQDKSSL